MKKVFAVLAVLAVAAAAQAELLATWNISGSTQTVKDEKPDVIGFTTLTATEGIGWGKATGGAFRANNWAAGGSPVAGNYVETQFITEDPSMTFTLEKIEMPFSVGNPGAAHFIWKNENDAPVTQSAGAAASGTGIMTFNAVDGATWTESGALRLYAADGLTVGGGNASSGSRTDIRDGMKVYGTVGAVPEPATMSLLGLGALAMALRRKLRK